MVFGVANDESEVKILKFQIADPIWLANFLYIQILDIKGVTKTYMFILWQCDLSFSI